MRGFRPRIAAALSAALFVAFLVAPALAQSPLPPPERASSSTRDDGMAATPSRATVVDVSVAPCGGMAPTDAPSARLLLRLDAPLLRIFADRSSRLAASLKAAPLVLRV